ncbi:MAG: hypothetical protein ABR568_22330, partial [Pyrinomonadaceae bacterium]
MVLTSWDRGELTANVIIFGEALLHDRDEEEVRGYRDALKLIYEQGTNLPTARNSTRCHDAVAGGSSLTFTQATLYEVSTTMRQRVGLSALVALN